MAESTSEFNDLDSDYLDANCEFSEEDIIQLNLNPDNNGQFIGESTSLHEHGFHDPPTGWDQDPDEDEHQRSAYEHQLPVPTTGWDRDPNDDDNQPSLPSDSDSEDQLSIQSTEWDSYLDYEHQPRTLSFHRVCRCLPFSKYKSPTLERGDKIILPPSHLAEIVSLGLEFPLFFEIENTNSNRTSHCGVLEFDGPEGFIFMPEWMMKNLKLEEDDCLIIRSASLSPGSYMKLQPHATAFTEISNPKAVLERTLRDFTCLSRGDTFMIRYNEKEFYLDVLEVTPANAITLVETDCQVEFAPPLDYKEPEPESESDSAEVERKEESAGEFRPFTGTARRMDGNPVTVPSAVQKERKTSPKDDGKEAGKEKFKPFTGRSHTLGSS